MPMKKIWTYLIFLLLISAGCSNSSSVNNDINLEEVSPAISQNAENTPVPEPTPIPTLQIVNAIDLEFEPHGIKPLTRGKPDEKWQKVYSVYYGELPNQKEANISFYWDKPTDDQEKDPKDPSNIIKKVHVYLEAGESSYNLCSLEYLNFDDMKDIEVVDLTNDGIKDFIIRGFGGATCELAWVIGYKDGQWYQLLDYTNLTVHDLDGDGKQELVSSSFGSLPPFVQILRWNGTCFEIADVTEFTKMDYATLNYEYDNWIITSGKISESYDYYYIYKDGKLHQIALDEKEDK